MCCVQVGDETMSVLEIWGAEYQENDCLLIKPESRDLLQAVCDRERCFMQVGPGVCLDQLDRHSKGFCCRVVEGTSTIYVTKSFIVPAD